MHLELEKASPMGTLRKCYAAFQYRKMAKIDQAMPLTTLKQATGSLKFTNSPVMMKPPLMVSRASGEFQSFLVLNFEGDLKID
uniref:Uncharacterized protein n=1 Tax=Arundo donax TaxID=35708 RepID=A0A0A9G1M7_ARUDO